MNPDANIKFSLIVGLPGDNFESFCKSLEFVISLNPTDIYVHDLLVLPGSEMYENPEKFNLIMKVLILTTKTNHHDYFIHKTSNSIKKFSSIFVDKTIKI